MNLEAHISPLGGNKFRFTLEGGNANLTGTVKPITIVLRIGNDIGKTAAKQNSKNNLI